MPDIGRNMSGMKPLSQTIYKKLIRNVLTPEGAVFHARLCCRPV